MFPGDVHNRFETESNSNISSASGRTIGLGTHYAIQSDRKLQQ